MVYYIIEPEVAGEIGENTKYENYDEIVKNGAKPIISHLHFVFEGWLGDELLEVTPCFLVSERIKKAIETYGISGCVFTEVEVSFSDVFLELYPDREMPVFYRLIPQHVISTERIINDNQDLDDIMISQKMYLVISERFRRILTSLRADKYAEYEILTDE